MQQRGFVAYTMKYCYHHLKTGKKYEDQMILNFEKAQQISEWMSLNAR
jgi:hypothetical protein